MTTNDTLQQTINDMVDEHRGILAADESLPTIAKRFAAIDVESTEEHRRAYRSLLLDTEDLGDYISGVILFEETLGQKDAAGTFLPAILNYTISAHRSAAYCSISFHQQPG